MCSMSVVSRIWELKTMVVVVSGRVALVAGGGGDG